jgi:predicted Zn-dependent peptidase
MSDIVVHTLSCGATVLCEKISGVRSVGIAWMIPGGSAYDPAHLQGRGTLWSELLLRGAGDLDSRDQADAFDRLGVSRSCDLGAYTIRIGATLMGSCVQRTLPLLMDMVLRPRMDDDALEPSRELALAALETLKDDPQERAAHLARDRHYAPPLNRSGLGSVEGLQAITIEDLRSGWANTVVPGGENRSGALLGFAGDIEPEAIIAQLEELTSSWRGSINEPVCAGTPPRGYAHEEDPSNQVQIIVLHDAPSESSDESILEKVLVNILSGGMAGRLFTQVREKRGLCYSVNAGYRGERDFGSVSAYVGTTPDKAQQSLDVLFDELKLLSTPQGRITRGEFDRAITGMITGVVFSGESTGARASSIISDYRRLGRARSLAEVTAQVRSVTLDKVNAYLAQRQMGTVTIQTLGPAQLIPPASM